MFCDFEGQWVSAAEAEVSQGSFSKTCIHGRVCCCGLPLSFACFVYLSVSKSSKAFFMKEDNSLSVDQPNSLFVGDLCVSAWVSLIMVRHFV